MQNTQNINLKKNNLNLSTPYSQLTSENEFIGRHIGPDQSEQTQMLNELGFSSLEEMASKVIPKNIRHQGSVNVGDGISEYEILKNLKQMMSKNKVFKSYIGLGYHDCITPSVILRNVFENPVWYTAYTPYQPEISQGRLQSLLNFQTVIKDLTQMEIANASLLDEGTAAAEAMSMAHSLCKKSNANEFFVSHLMHPHVIEVLKTRSEPLGLKMHVVDVEKTQLHANSFAVFVQYPNSLGDISNYKGLADLAHNNGSMLIASVDLLSLTLLTPPGGWGADIVVGNSQRFGVPLGFGGPHAAFLATKDANKRLMPGRLVGLSVDAQGQAALRLALQTREQHIRREKATSNICTAQVLLANMAAMYAVYHGPEGLKKIALRIHKLTQTLKMSLESMGLKCSQKNIFDTIFIEHKDSEKIIKFAETQSINFRAVTKSQVEPQSASSFWAQANIQFSADPIVGLSLSLNETTTESDLSEILNIFSTALGLKNVDVTQFISQNTSHSIETVHVRSSSFLTHPTFNSYHSETKLMRYIFELQGKDLTLTHSMIPLGSCTMKLNAATELIPVSWPEVNKIHPFVPNSQSLGYLELTKDLEKKLCAITGFHAVSLQPNAGSQGEYAGLLVIREYFKATNQSHRNICLIPSSAHGTNPASAVMAGMEVVVVNCDDLGNVDVKDLAAKATQHKDNLAALMVTYPSTHGVFEEAITEICDIVHKCGGQVYMDGANLNALVAVAQPGVFGPDVMHMNLHKTFSIPHGGGGPGVGPIGVSKHLAPYLPRHSLNNECGPQSGVSSTTSAPWGSASILPISWSYITMLGSEGLKQSTLVSILSANYIAKKLAPHYPILYKGKEGLVAHECILDLRPIKKSSSVDVTDVAKRLIDYGFHAPTMSWPVAGTLMVEPTESESKAELDRFIEAMIQIKNEVMEIEKGQIEYEKSPLFFAPHTSQVITKSWDRSYSLEKAVYPVDWLRKNKYWPSVGRVDNAYGDRNLVCACPSIDEYK